MRTAILQIEIDDYKAIDADVGTIDYLEKEFIRLEERGIYLKNTRIVDDDDQNDTTLSN